MLTGGSTCGSSIYSATYAQINPEFGISQEVAVLGLSLYVLGMGTGEYRSASARAAVDSICRPHYSCAAVRVLRQTHNLPLLLHLFHLVYVAMRAGSKHRGDAGLPLPRRYSRERIPVGGRRHRGRHVFRPITRRPNDDFHRKPGMLELPAFPHPANVSSLLAPRSARWSAASSTRTSTGAGRTG